MEPIVCTNSPLSPGDSVTVIWFEDGSPHTRPASLVSNTHTQVAFQSEPAIAKGTWLILVAQLDGQIFRAEGHCGPLICQSGLWTVSMGQVAWTQADRRQSHRIPIELPVSASIIDQEADFQDFVGHTVDLSDSGAMMELPVQPPLHSLVRWELQIPRGRRASGLGMVTRHDDGSRVGLQFVEYMGNSRSLIADLLYDRAA